LVREVKMEFRQVVKNHCDISPVTNFLNVNHAKAASEGKPLVVLIAPQEKDRTKAQNRLLHMWFGEMAKRTGDSAESIKYEMKKKFLAKIYLRDNAETQEAYEAVIAYRDVIKTLQDEEKKIHTAQYQRIVRMFIKDHVRSRDATKKQFSEFCDKLHAFANMELGVYLKCPDDLKYVLE
ncbi:hypothetical protein, partial [Acinetobacter baumannii]|uniref:hypothetical protein n=2 Tax=Acinetobacter baumannii TaxID=470 RepID=UPI002AF6B75B